jgi:hypothetical protein
MPAIKVYKTKGTMIPIDEAKVAKAYQCPWTSKLYATKKSYVKHLANLRENRIRVQIRQKAHQKKMEEWWNQPTFEDIVKWVEMNPEFFWQRGRNSGYYKQEWDDIRDDFWIKITYIDARWSGCVSNMHDAPRTGVSNFRKKAGNPDGYPGWEGRIEFRSSHRIPGFSTDQFRGTGINTGTGSGISDNRYGYSLRMFADDWPGLANQRSWDVLRDTCVNAHRVGEPYYYR